MIRRLRFLIVSITVLFFAFTQNGMATSHTSHFTGTSNNALATFSTARAAQVHCPKDVVVWLNTKTGIWHKKGTRWYGRTKYGAYVCRREAAAVGDRGSENGQ